MSTIKIRSVAPEDNQALAQVIRDVLIEMGVPKVGTAYEDEALDVMYETYDAPRKKYFVVEDDGKIIGGAGIAQLEKGSSEICELQKMYFLPEARGKGLGSQMMSKCLDFAKEQGFVKCYLETMPYMKEARKLYGRVGFKALDAPMGDTGHYSCQAWMIKDL
ncbi:GNAT family N-acetyltransferase [Aquimarina sp. MMG015]|uniref:GNAT family N-acetyltransferase n=1 Tax=Aquimarina TaxID=290174 RepID=UPI00040B26CF|nr:MULTISPECIES: GNAT family N-acetyltransferase [Aquimarina]AXT54778.1 GNAT family N-acetyltransferase [Aquimarina sp. AD1]MBQ4804813.1 GNAT family N-acetyltransferase [Aquimarina sp. MMG015]RKN08449.1 GNAT family N-acetyltransferase [Aquimarina sp. AD1]